jgi:hypothetical protein
MALRLHAVILADAHHGIRPRGPTGEGPAAASGGATGITETWGIPRAEAPESEDNLHVIEFRDLAAVVSEQKSFALDESATAGLGRHRAVVDAIFRRAAVLPAPAGVVFRTPEVLRRWMELHYVSLTDALEFVNDRAVARVHIARADARQELDPGSDLAAATGESFRALRRRSVAAVPLRHEETTGLVLSAAFLVERDLWNDFMNAVNEQRDAHHHLRYDVTGPWAPYDFVRMQFGG